MRQLAWLSATPKPPPGTKRSETGAQLPTLSRIEQMKQNGIKPKLPRNPAPHIIQRWREIGPTEAAGMGAGPIRWQSIEAWQNASRTRLSRWEQRMIRQLSLDYLAESQKADSENCPPPWRGKVTQREREVELDQLRSVLG